MNILYSAFECNPYKGSEANCGWSWAYAMSKVNSKDKIYLLTRYENKQYIEKYMKEKEITNINVLYCDVPDWMNLYKKYGKYYFIYYKMWQTEAYKFVKRMKQIKFDVIQHITLGDFRIIGKLWKIKKSKFIFGPVGGGQLTPKCLEEYTKKYIVKEKKREIINKIVRNNPFYRRAIKKCWRVYCANEETANFLKPIVKDTEKIKILTENGISKEYLVTAQEKREEKGKDETIRILWAGRMMYRKGLIFLIEVFSTIQTTKKIELHLVGTGVQEKELKDFVKQKKLETKVIFKGKCDYFQMKKEYQRCDFFVFPSIRETTGTVLFEAMANYLPIISFNQNGAKILIKNNMGILIELSNIDKMKKDFKEAIETLINDREKRLQMGNNARREIEENYTWEKKCEDILKEYEDM